MKRIIVITCALWNLTSCGGAPEEIGMREQATTCETNCSASCQVSYNYPCPTWRNPGRTCQGHQLDPLCKVRCEAERELECNSGVNACAIWETNPQWLATREVLRTYAGDGLTTEKCVEIVKLGGGAAGAGQAIYTAYVEGIKAALELNPAAIVAGKGAEHGAICACRRAL